MNDIDRETVHKLVDQLPEGELVAAKRYLERLARSPEQAIAHDQREAETINAHAAELNAEAEDVLGYQAEW